MTYLTTSPLYCALFLNYHSRGWGEYYALRQNDERLALDHCRLIMEARSWVMARDVEVEWACLRNSFPIHWEQAVIGDKLTALPQWGPPQDPYTRLYIRADDGFGAHGRFFFHGIDDDEITKDGWVSDPFPLPPTLPAPPPVPALATKVELWRYLLCLLREYCAKFKDMGTNNLGEKQWLVRPWKKLEFRHVSSKELPPRYRRCSWEPIDVLVQPHFSPCGEAVTVLRMGYQAPCRFYAGGPVQGIRYYYAPPAAKVLDIPTIFWGWAREKVLTNGAAAGEITAQAGRIVTYGYSFSAAPGDHYEGTDENYLGLSTIPWAPPTPTPSIYQVGCNVAVPAPIKFRDSGSLVVQIDGRDIIFDKDDFTVSIPGPNQFLVKAKCGCNDPCTAECDWWSTDTPAISPSNPFSLNLCKPAGVNTQILFPTAPIRVPKWSAGFWAKFASMPDVQALGSLGDNFLRFFIRPAGVGTFYFYFTYERGAPFSPTWLISALSDPIAYSGGWHHYGFSADSTSGGLTAKLYFDGVPQTTTFSPPFPSPLPPLSSAITDWMMPVFNNAYTESWYDDLRTVEGSNWTDAEFAALAAGAGPVGSHRYKMNEGEGLIVHDSGPVPLPGYIRACLTPDACYPTGSAKYGALVVGGKVLSLGEDITEITCRTIA